MAKCKNGTCGMNQSQVPQVATPVNPGFEQAQLYGNQYGAMPNTQLPKKSFWKGSKEAIVNFPTQTPAQNQLANQSIMQAMQLLGGGPDFSGWDPIQAEYEKYYNEDLIPSLAHRFTSMGNGAQNSSAFANSLKSGSQDFAKSLAALKSQYGLQQQGLGNQRLATLLSGGMAPQFQQSYIPAQPGALQNFGTALAGGAGSVVSLLAKALGL
jgi:hypothetical protein